MTCSSLSKVKALKKSLRVYTQKVSMKERLTADSFAPMSTLALVKVSS